MGSTHLGKRTKRTGNRGQSHGGNGATASCLFQLIHSTDQQRVAYDLVSSVQVLGLGLMGDTQSCMFTPDPQAAVESAGQHNTLPSASYTPGETESPCKLLGRE